MEEILSFPQAFRNSVKKVKCQYGKALRGKEV